MEKSCTLLSRYGQNPSWCCRDMVKALDGLRENKYGYDCVPIDSGNSFSWTSAEGVLSCGASMESPSLYFRPFLMHIALPSVWFYHS